MKRWRYLLIFTIYSVSSLAATWIILGVFGLSHYVLTRHDMSHTLAAPSSTFEVRPGDVLNVH